VLAGVLALGGAFPSVGFVSTGDCSPLTRSPGGGATAVHEAAGAEQRAQEELGALLRRVAKHLEAWREGDREAARKAERDVERARELAPRHPRVLLFSGCVKILRGRDASLPFRKMQLVNSGLADMDEATRLAPDDVQVRLTRAMYCLALPAIFARADTAVVDLSHLKALADARTGALPQSLEATVLYQLARAYAATNRPEEAEALLLRVRKQFPESEEAEAASRMLQTMRSGARR